jgi:hypothetical protein
MREPRFSTSETVAAMISNRWKLLTRKFPTIGNFDCGSPYLAILLSILQYRGSQNPNEKLMRKSVDRMIGPSYSIITIDLI